MCPYYIREYATYMHASKLHGLEASGNLEASDNLAAFDNLEASHNPEAYQSDSLEASACIRACVRACASACGTMVRMASRARPHHVAPCVTWGLGRRYTSVNMSVNSSLALLHADIDHDTEMVDHGFAQHTFKDTLRDTDEDTYKEAVDDGLAQHSQGQAYHVVNGQEEREVEVVWLDEEQEQEQAVGAHGRHVHMMDAGLAWTSFGAEALQEASCSNLDFEVCKLF